MFQIYLKYILKFDLIIALFLFSSAWILRIVGKDGVQNKDEIVRLKTKKDDENIDEDIPQSQNRKRNMDSACQNIDVVEDKKTKEE